MEIIGGNAFGYIERYDALVKHRAKKKIVFSASSILLAR